MAYVYRHIRLDKNEPFYIGIGSDSNYSRAYTRKNRNKIWKYITNKSDFRVEIMVDDISKDYACKKEMEYISLYGKIINSTGILANITDGGDGVTGYSHKTETKLAISHKKKKYQFTRSHKINISNGRKDKQTKRVIDKESGYIYNSLKEASKSIKISYSTLAAMLNGQNPNKTNLMYI